MAVGKNKRVSKGGKRGNKKKTTDPMIRKEWYDVVAPANFKTRQFTKTICNKSGAGFKAETNIIGRVFEGCLADLNNATDKDLPFRKVKFAAKQVDGRNILTQFHSMDLTADRIRSLVHKWGSMIESVVEAKTADGYVLRLFLIAFTKKQKGQLSKNSYAKTRLEKWVRHRMTSMIQKRLAQITLDVAVKELTQDVLADNLFKRCNPILPLRDLKIRKVKVTRLPPLDSQAFKLTHGEIPESNEGKVAEAAPVEVAVAAE